MPSVDTSRQMSDTNNHTTFKVSWISFVPYSHAWTSAGHYNLVYMPWCRVSNSSPWLIFAWTSRWAGLRYKVAPWMHMEIRLCKLANYQFSIPVTELKMDSNAFTHTSVKHTLYPKGNWHKSNVWLCSHLNSEWNSWNETSWALKQTWYFHFQHHIFHFDLY